MTYNWQAAEKQCPKCEGGMERGITEYGLICIDCSYFEDDCRWSMEGEYLDENGEAEVSPAITEDCTSCAEQQPKLECPHSRRDCGHHCNHVWSQDRCCWCGKEFGEVTATTTGE